MGVFGRTQLFAGTFLVSNTEIETKKHIKEPSGRCNGSITEQLLVLVTFFGCWIIVEVCVLERY